MPAIEATSQLIEMPKLPEKNIYPISFLDFLRRVYPDVDDPLVFAIIQQVICNLRPDCIEDKQGVFAYVKKGAMRVFSLDNRPAQDRFLDVFEGLDQTTIGEDPMVKAIIAENFSRPMDLDIRIYRKSAAGSRVDIYPKITAALLSFGFLPNCSSDQNTFSNDKYSAEIKIIPIGGPTNLTKWELDIYPRGTLKPVFRLDLADLPQTQEEKNFNVTDTNHAADTDSVVGYIVKGSNLDLVVLYHQTKGRPDIYHQMITHYLDAASEPLTFDTNVARYLMQGVREIAHRAMMPRILKMEPYHNITLDYLIAVKHQNWGPANPLAPIIPQWIKWQEHLLTAKKRYLISCALGMVSANPLVSLLLFWLDQYASFTPFGQLISDYNDFYNLMLCISSSLEVSPLEPLWKLAEAYVNKVITQAGRQFLGHRLMIESLKLLGKLPQNTPPTLSTAACLLDPLLLPDDQWKRKLNW